MIKKIIFDIDNTLIQWKSEYSIKTVEETYKDLDLTYNINLINKTNEAVDNYERKHDYFNKTLLLEDINAITNQNLPTNFVDIYLSNCIKYGTPKKLPDEIIETLQYLYSKYELVILTNWFLNPQIQRLKNVGIYKYFSNIIATETIKVKPNKESFLTAIGSNKIDECYMIGDCLNIDIKGSLDIGLKAVYLTSNNINFKNCICINNFEDLKKIF